MMGCGHSTHGEDSEEEKQPPSISESTQRRARRTWRRGSKHNQSLPRGMRFSVPRIERTARKSLEMVVEKRSSLLHSGHGEGTSKNKQRISSITEALKWADPRDGFQNLLNSVNGRKLFQNFLRMEYSEENLLFWMACEEASRNLSREEFEQKVENIFEEFLTPSSPKEVSLDFRVRDAVMAVRSQPTKDMFMECQAQIYSLMHRDSYPRFLVSDIYKKYLYNKS